MKQLLITLLIICLASCSPHTVELMDLEVKQKLSYAVGESKPYSGRVVEHYSKGTLKTEAFYKEGRQHGAYKEYAPNGILLAQHAYKDGVPHGKWRTYYTDGKIQLESGYRNGLKNGRFRSYNREGKLEEESNYIDGVEVKSQQAAHRGLQ